MPPIDWSQIGAAPIFERGNYFNPGRYKLRLLRCLSKQTQKSGMAFIAEFEVLESDNPAHPIGSKGTYFVKMAQQMEQMASEQPDNLIRVIGVNPVAAWDDVKGNTGSRDDSVQPVERIFTQDVRVGRLDEVQLHAGWRVQDCAPKICLKEVAQQLLQGIEV